MSGEKRIDDGFSTLITFKLNESVYFWEKTVTPPGIEAGGANDTTTMRNEEYRTKAPKLLKTLTDGAIKAAYAPKAYTQIIAMVGVNQKIKVTFADDSELIFWGFIDKFTPDEIQEGQQPTAAVTFIPTNQDADGDEIDPVYVTPDSSAAF
jgi:hypothetical protein